MLVNQIERKQSATDSSCTIVALSPVGMYVHALLGFDIFFESVKFLAQAAVVTLRH